jgi:hypothetical protein
VYVALAEAPELIRYSIIVVESEIDALEENPLPWTGVAPLKAHPIIKSPDASANDPEENVLLLPVLER